MFGLGIGLGSRRFFGGIGLGTGVGFKFLESVGIGVGTRHEGYPSDTPRTVSVPLNAVRNSVRPWFARTVLPY